MQRYGQIQLLVWRKVIHRVVPLNRGMGLSIQTPNRIRRAWIWLACTRGYDGVNLRLFPPSRLRIMLYKMIPILGQGWRYVFSIGWGQWGLPSNRGLHPNWDFSYKRGLSLASLVNLSTSRNLVIRCEIWDGATRISASDRGWKRSSERGWRKCQSETEKMVLRRSGTARSPGCNLCQSGNRSIQRIISGWKWWGESGRKQCANGCLASCSNPSVRTRSIWDHCVMDRL
jgi:hypothetical protein